MVSVSRAPRERASTTGGRTDDELVGPDAARLVPLDGLVDRRLVRRAVQLGLVARRGRPRPLEIVRHDVPEREVTIHAADVEKRVRVGAGRGGDLGRRDG